MAARTLLIRSIFHTAPCKRSALLSCPVHFLDLNSGHAFILPQCVTSMRTPSPGFFSRSRQTCLTRPCHQTTAHAGCNLTRQTTRSAKINRMRILEQAMQDELVYPLFARGRLWRHTLPTTAAAPASTPTPARTGRPPIHPLPIRRTVLPRPIAPSTAHTCTTATSAPLRHSTPVPADLRPALVLLLPHLKVELALADLDSALTALLGRQGSDDRLARALESGELDKGACLALDNLNLGHVAEARCGDAQGGLVDRAFSRLILDRPVGQLRYDQHKFSQQME